MHQQDVGDAWAADETAAERRTAGPIPAAADADDPNGGAEVLARIPDLEAAKASPADGKASRSDGRVISQGLSTKILLGGGALLVAVAIIPRMFNKDDPKPDQPGLPAWQSSVPAPSAEEAPAWTGADARVAHTPPAGAIEQAPGWDTGAQVPPIEGQSSGLGGMEPSQADMPHGTSTLSPQLVREPAPLPDDQGPPARYGGRFEPAQPNTGYYRAYQPGPTQTNRPMSIGDRPPTAIYGWGPERQGDYRAGPQTDERRDDQTDSKADPGGRYSRQSAPAAQPAHPGVARLEGIIVKPSGRDTHERVRSGVY